MDFSRSNVMVHEVDVSKSNTTILWTLIFE